MAENNLEKTDETTTDHDKKLKYYKNYYHNKYKNIIKEKKEYCECCKLEFASWNLYKHRKSKKHQINSLSEEEKLNYVKQQQLNKFLAKVEQKFKMLNIEKSMYN